MRDPLAPIPSPARDPGFWHATTTPRATRLPTHLRGEAPIDEYSPLRLLERNQGDTHGLDRRSRSRASLSPPVTQDQDQDHGSARLLSGAHRRVDLVLGLSTSHGWALVRTLSGAPAGLLLHLLDLLDPALPPGLRTRGQGVLRRLAPGLGAPLRPTVREPGSPLAMVGGCLLAPRVVADLSSFASQPVGRRGTSQRAPATLTVSLLIPGDAAQLPASGGLLHGIHCIEAELVPMTDPQPQVLAVALSPRALAQLELASGGRLA